MSGEGGKGEIVHRVHGKIHAVSHPKCRISSLFHRVIWLTGLFLTGGGVALAHSTSGWGAVHVAIYLGPKVAAIFLAASLAAYFIVKKKVPEQELPFLMLSSISSPVISWLVVAAFTFVFRPFSDC